MSVLSDVGVLIAWVTCQEARTTHYSYLRTAV